MNLGSDMVRKGLKKSTFQGLLSSDPLPLSHLRGRKKKTMGLIKKVSQDMLKTFYILSEQSPPPLDRGHVQKGKFFYALPKVFILIMIKMACSFSPYLGSPRLLPVPSHQGRQPSTESLPEYLHRSRSFIYYQSR